MPTLLFCNYSFGLNSKYCKIKPGLTWWANPRALLPDPVTKRPEGNYKGAVANKLTPFVYNHNDIDDSRS